MKLTRRSLLLAAPALWLPSRADAAKVLLFVKANPAPTPIGVIDFENKVYSWGGVSKARSDLAGTSGPWIFDPAHLTANGYEGEAYFAIIGDALTALIAGCVMVFDCFVTAGPVVSVELYDAPGFNTDGIYSRGNVASGILDGNGGGNCTTANGGDGRAKAAFLVTAATQSVSDNGGVIATCLPAIARPVEPNTAGTTVGTGNTLYSIKFYASGTDLQVVSAA